MGVLYVVATPIGNLEDITLRALRVLRKVALVAAEDTRITRKLLVHFGIRARLLSYHRHNAAQRIPRILQTLETGDVALVSDAGVPVVSDPGHELVRAVTEAGFRAVPVPGPSAVTAALAVAGLQADSFLMLGFLPRLRRNRLKLLRSVVAIAQPLVIFEAPHRLQASLQDTLAILGDRHLTVCRELTKLYEEVFHGTVAGAMAHFDQPRGEFVLVVSGAGPVSTERGPDWDAVRRELAKLKAKGSSRRDAVGLVRASYAISQRDAYRLWLEVGVS